LNKALFAINANSALFLAMNPSQNCYKMAENVCRDRSGAIYAAAWNILGQAIDRTFFSATADRN
jgi:hypothetical protein